MSDMYAIKASTLTALGDAVRDKTGNGEEKVEGIVLSNATKTNYTFTTKSSGISYRYIINATSTNVSSSRQFIIYENDINGKILFEQRLDNENYTITVETNTSTIYLNYNLWNGVETNRLECDITAIPLDENGNEYKYTPLEMAEQINELEVPKVEPIVLTDNCQYACAGAMASQFISLFPDKATTKDITNATNMFNKSQLTKIPFDLNFKQGSNHTIDNVFNGCNLLEIPPRMINPRPSSMKSMFEYCHRLREIPDDYFDSWDWGYLSGLTNSLYGGAMSSIFSKCNSLRKLPPLKVFSKGNMNITHTQSFYYYLFTDCYILDEIVGLPFPHYASTWTSNAFYYAFYSCHRLKKITFALQEDGSPYVMNWKSQTIDLSGANNNFPVGYAIYSSYILTSNSDITADKEVVDDATYQALKNDPDWFTTKVEYSRYNHDSAVETINSLPDTSAYLATAGGTNTIKFKGAAGSLTDGGAINTLTEEEIAVATAKGWTISFA